LEQKHEKKISQAWSIVISNSLKEKITEEGLKRVFSYFSEYCKEDKQMFIQLWQSYNSSYWNQTRLTNASTSEIQFLDNFMNKQIQDVEYFVDAQRTCFIETFHTISLPNIAPRKPLIHSRCIL
jgi:type IV secretory pathway component VirB8